MSMLHWENKNFAARSPKIPVEAQKIFLFQQEKFLLRKEDLSFRVKNLHENIKVYYTINTKVNDDSTNIPILEKFFQK